MRFSFLAAASTLLALAAPVSAQERLALDQDCTVTIGNQTAIVRPDGTFFIRNISVFESRDTGVAPQLYRVRATCIRGGEMLTGQSRFFSLVPGDTVLIADVFPSQLDPIPVSINAAAPADVIPLGSSLQLTVTATLPDGSSEDVSSRAAGTTFLSTNPNLLTVTENGLVTGANGLDQPRTGTIAVLNEGNLATFSFTAVGPSNDFDNDGLPNDFEELFGLNPLADDAQGDLDGDGLSNLEEFQRGTIPSNPDTDADGIADGLDGDPLRPEETPPVVTILSPQDGDVLVEGETIPFRVDAVDDGLISSIELFINGADFGVFSNPPVEIAFTVPYLADPLDFQVRASDSAGNVSTALAATAVIADPLTTVEGTVTDPDGVPIGGADVTLELDGLKGEFFDLDAPLAALPDLSGLVPDRTILVSDVNFLNPGNLLSPDTFGLGFSPGFAARFTGLIQLPGSGNQTFILGADDGARLSIDGNPVLEVAPAGEFAEAEVTLALPAGPHSITIEYFQSEGDAELRLAVLSNDFGPNPAFSTAAQPPRPLADLMRSAAHDSPPKVLVESESDFRILEQDPDSFTSVTDGLGFFAIPQVPTILGEIRARASARIAGDEFKGRSQPASPVRGEVTDLGRVEISAAALVGYYDLSLNQGNPLQIQPIATAELAPEDVGDLDAADLSRFDILFVQNPETDFYPATYANNLNKISEFVSQGGILVFHDRHVETAADVLPGFPGFFARDFNDDQSIEIVDATTAVTNGPGGVLTNTSLDGGNSSSHGFADATTLPAGARPILSRTVPDEVVTFSYPFGQGHVIYSTIPLDFYLPPDSNPGAFREIYAPNVLAYADDLR